MKTAFLERLHRRRVALALLLTGPMFACAALINLPDPTLDETIGKTDATADTAQADGFTELDGDIADGQSTEDTAPITCPGVDLQTDKANCGRCLHDCSAGSCEKGVCTLLTTTAEMPAGLFAHGNRLFIALAGLGGIVECPTSGCTKPTVVTKELDVGNTEPFAITGNNDNIYWANYYESGGSSGVYRTPYDGGKSVHLGGALDHAGANPQGITLEGTTVHVTTDNLSSPFSVPQAGGTVKAYRTDAGTNAVDEIVAVGGHVFWSYYEEIWDHVCTSTASCTDKLFVRQDSGSNSLATDGTSLYFMSYYDGVLNRCGITDCSAPQVLFTDKTVKVSGLAVNGNTIVITQYNTYDEATNTYAVDGKVKKCTLVGTTATCVDIATGLGRPYGPHIANGSVFWSVIDGNKPNNLDSPGRVMKAPL